MVIKEMQVTAQQVINNLRVVNRSSNSWGILELL